MKANFQNTLVKNAGLPLLNNGGDMWMKQIISERYFQTYELQQRNSEDAKLCKTQNVNRQIGENLSVWMTMIKMKMKINTPHSKKGDDDGCFLTSQHQNTNHRQALCPVGLTSFRFKTFFSEINETKTGF